MHCFALPRFPISFLWLISYISGVILTHTLFTYTFSSEYICITGALIIIIALYIYMQKKSFLLLILCIGMARTTYILYRYNQYHFSSNHKLYVHDIYYTGNPQWSFCTLLHDTTTENNVILYTKRKPWCTVGQTVTSGLPFKRPSYNSFTLFLLKDNIYATAFAYTFRPTIIHNPSFSLRRTIHTLRDKTLKNILKKCSYKTGALFASLFAGNKKLFKKSLHATKILFRSWGIVHHLARSGLHLIIMLGGWYAFLSLLPLSYTTKSIIIGIITFLLSLFSFSTISFSRSLFFFGISQLLVLTKQQTHSVHILSLVALCFLMYRPFLLFSLDFQLSFFITYVLCFIALVTRQKKLAGCKLLLIDYKNA